MQRSTLALIVLAAIGTSGPSAADSEHGAIETIVVTAQRPSAPAQRPVERAAEAAVADFDALAITRPRADYERRAPAPQRLALTTPRGNRS
jgi:hypothetical protein